MHVNWASSMDTDIVNVAAAEGEKEFIIACH
jgi:hypothetical protein